MSQDIKDILWIFTALFAFLIVVAIIALAEGYVKEQTKQMELQVKILELQKRNQ